MPALALFLLPALALAAQSPAPPAPGAGEPSSAETAASDPEAAGADGTRAQRDSGAKGATAPGNLERGLELFDALEFEYARKSLEAALDDRDLSREQLVQLYATLGIVRAYLEDADGARAAFDSLLAIAPGHTLPYTTSPKATFVFEKARTEAKTRRALELTLRPPTLQRLGEPVTLEVARTADPFGDVETVEIWHRRKGTDAWSKLTFKAPSVGQSVRATLPAVSEDEAFVDDTGARGAYIEVAVVGRSALGWEVFRGPDPERPHELPVGFDAPGPWYTTWWFWSGTLAAAAASALATGTVAAAAVLYKPENVPLEVKKVPQ